MVEKLIEDYNNNDAAVQDLLNYWTVYISPSLNPDGRRRTHGLRMHRFSFCYRLRVQSNQWCKFVKSDAHRVRRKNLVESIVA